MSESQESTKECKTCDLTELPRSEVTSAPDPRAEAKTNSEANAANFIVVCLTVDVCLFRSTLDFMTTSALDSTVLVDSTLRPASHQEASTFVSPCLRAAGGPSLERRHVPNSFALVCKIISIVVYIGLRRAIVPNKLFLVTTQNILHPCRYLSQHASSLASYVVPTFYVRTVSTA